VQKLLGFDSGNYNTFGSCTKHPDCHCCPSNLKVWRHSVAWPHGTLSRAWNCHLVQTLWMCGAITPLLLMPSHCVGRENVLYCCCLCNSLHCTKEDIGIYLCGGSENAFGTVTRYEMDDLGFQLQCWQNKHYNSTSLRIPVFKQCKNITR